MHATTSIETQNSKDTCFLCGMPDAFSDAYKGYEIEGGKYSIQFCRNCKVGRTDPFLGEEELKKIYSSTYRADDSTRFFSPLEKIIRFLRVQRCKDVERRSKVGRILDVGCGRADFLKLMSERGWASTGVELDKRIEEHGRKIGLDLRHGSLEDVRFPDSYFDVVTLWHVFEHLRGPAWVIEECRRVLKPGGLLVISVPNIGSLQARLTGRHWFHLDPPFHLYHYSLENLRTLLGKSGFKVNGVKHFSLEYNPYGYLQSIYNAMGFRSNLFYDFLRSKAGSGAFAPVSLMFLLLPLLLPLSLFLSVAEALLRSGGTIDVYAVKEVEAGR